MILLHPNEQAGSRELASGHGFGTHRPAASEQQRDNCRPGRRHEVQCCFRRSLLGKVQEGWRLGGYAAFDSRSQGRVGVEGCGGRLVDRRLPPGVQSVTRCS
jgi:hypothetical protein